jgi:signal transduction histidine kinase
MPGLKPAHRQHISRRRWHELKSPHGGSELGLAMSRELAIQMNGSLSVDSDVEECCTFVLSLPAAR